MRNFLKAICLSLAIPILLLTACSINSSGGEDIPIQTTTLAAATEADPNVKRVLIPEGFTFWQIAQRLEQEGICGARAFFDAAQSYEVQSFEVPKDPDVAYRYEGYLWPATYELELGEDPVSVLRKMLNAYAANSGMPDRKTLILASIIEREVRSDEQMALVSSVFHNRMTDKSERWTLGSCPTRDYVNDFIVQEGTWIKNPDRFRVLFNTTRRDFNSNNFPLPAGAICNPGIRAINAALNPAKSDYFFFFFSADNVNHYSKTYKEHQEKIKEFGLGTF
ncbi:MAG: endolytic transglycosylase MltG [Oscillospiraceae bacterium]|nr:endolytic transglycosylase MltG [Oscillospiraceae bacterium]